MSLLPSAHMTDSHSWFGGAPGRHCCRFHVQDHTCRHRGGHGSRPRHDSLDALKVKFQVPMLAAARIRGYHWKRRMWRARALRDIMRLSLPVFADTIFFSWVTRLHGAMTSSSATSHQENTMFTFRTFLFSFFSFFAKKVEKVIPATFQITWQVGQKCTRIS